MNTTIKTFFLVVALSLLLIVGAIANYIMELNYNQNKLITIQSDRYKMIKKADELRQSSDDLTRYARIYVITGDTKYKDIYFKILDIRNGIFPRPKDYDGIYWDLSEISRSHKHSTDNTISLKEELRQLPYTEDEYKKLEESEANSNDLVNLEVEAFNAMKGLYQDHSEIDQSLAIKLLHSSEYHLAKEKIMLPIDDFLFLLKARTQKSIDSYTLEVQALFQKIFILFFLALILFILIAVMIKKKILTPIDNLTKTILSFQSGKDERVKTVQYNDEIGLMTNQFFIMKDKLDDDYRVIKKLKNRMKLALEGSRTSVLDWDFTTNDFYISPSWKEMLGFTDKELPNNILTWKQRVHRDDRKSVFTLLREYQSKKIRYFEHTQRLKHKDGSWIWIFGRAQILYDEDDKAIRMIGTHTDITEEKKLQLTASHQAQIIEQIHDSVISTDLEGVITSWNAGSEAILGHKTDEAVGQHITMIYREEDFESLSENIKFLMKNGELHAIAHLVKKSKEIVDVDLSLSLLRNEKGKPVGMIGYAQDITKRKKAEVALKEQHKYLQSIIDGINDPIMVIKEDYTVDLMNFSLRKNMGSINIADPEYPKCYEISHNRTTPCDGFDHPCPLRDVIDTKKHSIIVHDHYDANGEKRHVELSATPLFDKEKNCIGIIESSRDITEHLEIRDELEEQKDILHHQAHHDILTGLPNRILFNDRMEQGIEISKRNNRKLALFFIDLDHFKEINDSLGHKIGDEVLKIVTQVTNSVIRAEDTLARLGGDEFTVIMKDLKQGQDAALLAQKILDVLAEPIKIDGHILHLSSSIGISLYPDDGDSAPDLLKFADIAMYKAKDEGRNNFQFYSSDMTELVFERVMMEASLREALSNEEFALYYQPQVNAATEVLVGMEVLVRWQHPTMGLVSPENFISLLEKTGLIIQLDQWVMKTAMIQMVKWHEEGLTTGILALNLSMRQLEEKDFILTLKTILEETGCRPDCVELEITEGQIMNNPQNAAAILGQVSDMGIELAIDDFGMGYSSLSYLKRLPINKIKIDRSFVGGLPDDEEDVGIAKAVIALSQSLNLKVIAEGVETKEQRDFLVQNGCENIQGYYYGKPMPPSEIEVVLMRGFKS